MVSTNNGDRGKVKKLKDNLPFAYDRESEQGRRRLNTCLVCAFGYGAEGLWWAKPHTLPFSPTHPYGRKEQRPHKETKTGR